VRSRKSLYPISQNTNNFQSIYAEIKRNIKMSYFQESSTAGASSCHQYQRICDRSDLLRTFQASNRDCGQRRQDKSFRLFASEAIKSVRRN
jgi:hypothetical protein